MVFCKDKDPAEYTGVRGRGGQRGGWVVLGAPSRLAPPGWPRWVRPRPRVTESPFPCPPAQYEIELFRKAMPLVGWTDAMLNWTCMVRRGWRPAWLRCSHSRRHRVVPPGPPARPTRSSPTQPAPPCCPPGTGLVCHDRLGGRRRRHL